MKRYSTSTYRSQCSYPLVFKRLHFLEYKSILHILSYLGYWFTFDTFLAILVTWSPRAWQVSILLARWWTILFLMAGCHSGLQISIPMCALLWTGNMLFLPAGSFHPPENLNIFLVQFVLFLLQPAPFPTLPSILLICQPADGVTQILSLAVQDDIL